MERKTLLRNTPDDTATPQPAGAEADAGQMRDYRQEAVDGDSELAKSLGQLAELYNPANLVNSGGE